MSYPHSTNPITSFSAPIQILTSDLTPGTAIGGLTDQVTPLSANGIKNTIGYQISLIQNFVNSKYLGRPDCRVGSGYFDNILAGSGYYNNLFIQDSNATVAIGPDRITYSSGDYNIEINGEEITLSGGGTDFPYGDYKHQLNMSGIKMIYEYGGMEGSMHTVYRPNGITHDSPYTFFTISSTKGPIQFNPGINSFASNPTYNTTQTKFTSVLITLDDFELNRTWGEEPSVVKVMPNDTTVYLKFEYMAGRGGDAGIDSDPDTGAGYLDDEIISAIHLSRIIGIQASMTGSTYPIITQETVPLAPRCIWTGTVDSGYTEPDYANSGIILTIPVFTTMTPIFKSMSIVVTYVKP